MLLGRLAWCCTAWLQEDAARQRLADTCRDTCCRCIGLKKSSEPEIYNAIRFGSVLENVVFDEFTREVDFDSK